MARGRGGGAQLSARDPKRNAGEGAEAEYVVEALLPLRTRRDESVQVVVQGRLGVHERGCVRRTRRTQKDRNVASKVTFTPVAYPKEPHESVRNEDLQVGDMVHVMGWKRVIAIRPYTGPHAFVFALADTVPGVGFSLERGGYTCRSKAVT